MLALSTFHQASCASITGFRFLSRGHIFFSFTEAILFKILVSEQIFYLAHWINIVDGTNIVNLPEEWSGLNSICADNARGERCERSHFSQASVCWGDWAWQKGHAELSLMPERFSNLTATFQSQLFHITRILRFWILFTKCMPQIYIVSFQLKLTLYVLLFPNTAFVKASLLIFTVIGCSLTLFTVNVHCVLLPYGKCGSCH